MRLLLLFFASIWLIYGLWLPQAQAQPAFPGAEGFGANASGGRGGAVLYVTSLAPDPNGDTPGTLNWALRQPGARYVLFKVSGVIHAPAAVVTGNVTIAGQTSPGAVIVRGLICDGHYDRNNCGNLIVRHLRSRPAAHLGIPAGGAAQDDALRLDGIRNFIIDHSSFANATDECAQVSWASLGTIQHSILAETVGEHAQFGGMLMNYSHPDLPQDDLSIHHNLWQRLGGRLPEITCEASAYPGDPGSSADCAAHAFDLELTNNLLWDPGINIWYTRYVDDNPALGAYRVNLNWVENRLVSRPGFGFGMILDAILANAENNLYFSGNRMDLYPSYLDYQLAYCCNDFPGGAPNTDFGVATRRVTRHAFPPITVTPAARLSAQMVARVGAFPRDAMDRRFLGSVASGVVDLTPLDQPGANDAHTLDFDAQNPPPAPLDSDNDGMPDSFETQWAAFGLNPSVADHNGAQLSLAFTGVSGYTNLECYLNWLADFRVDAAPQTLIFRDGFEGS